MKDLKFQPSVCNEGLRYEGLRYKGSSVVQQFMGLPRKGSRIESQQWPLLRLVSCPFSIILNLIDAAVLTEIRIATSHCVCDARDIQPMKTHPYSQTVRYILAQGFMGDQMKYLNEHPDKINQKKKKKKHDILLCFSISCHGKRKRKRYTLGPRYENVPLSVNTGTFLVYQYCPKMWHLL